MTLGLGTRHEPDRGGLGTTPPHEDAAAHGGPGEVKASPTWAGSPSDLVRVSASLAPLELRSREALARGLLLPWGLSGARKALQLKVLEAWVVESVSRFKCASLPCSSTWRTLSDAFSPPEQWSPQL